MREEHCKVLWERRGGWCKLGGLPPDTDSNMWPSPPPVHPPQHAGFFFTNIMFPTQSLVESGQQNRWIFGKVPKGGGGLSQSKKLCRRFWSFKEGFKLFFFSDKKMQNDFLINHCLALTLAKMFTCQTKQVAEVWSKESWSFFEVVKLMVGF